MKHRPRGRCSNAEVICDLWHFKGKRIDVPFCVLQGKQNASLSRTCNNKRCDWQISITTKKTNQIIQGSDDQSFSGAALNLSQSLPERNDRLFCIKQTENNLILNKVPSKSQRSLMISNLPVTRHFSVFSWSGSHIRWGQAFRLRHLSTGHYLALTEDRGLVLQDREKCHTTATAFCFRPSKVSTHHLCASVIYSICF